MLREARAKCAADGRRRERGVHLPVIHLRRRGLFFLALMQLPIAGCKRLAGAGEELMLAFTVNYRF